LTNGQKAASSSPTHQPLGFTKTSVVRGAPSSSNLARVLPLWPAILPVRCRQVWSQVGRSYYRPNRSTKRPSRFLSFCKSSGFEEAVLVKQLVFDIQFFSSSGRFWISVADKSTVLNTYGSHGSLPNDGKRHNWNQRPGCLSLQLQLLRLQ
jgi:hypothetical protein